LKYVETPELKNFDTSDGREYFVNFEFRLKRDMPWAKAGYVQADEQLVLKAARHKTEAIAKTTAKTIEEDWPDTKIRLSGDGFEVVFDREDGSIYSLSYGGRKVFEDGCGPRLDAFRAWVNNDKWVYQNWYANGLHNLKHRNTSDMKGCIVGERHADGSMSIGFEIESQAPCGANLEGADRNWKRLVEQTDKPFGKDDFKFTQNIIYTVYPDGSIEANVAITSNNPQLVLPRLGYVMKTPSTMDNFRYYGRGPIDNYPDRKSSQYIGIYGKKVADEFENFPKPQDMANHQDTRWCSLTDANGAGALFIGREPMSVSVLPWSAQELAMANHPHELPASSGNWLHLDMAITGLGGASCGQGGPLEPDRVKAASHLFGFMIRPLSSQHPTPNIYHPKFNGMKPLQIIRSNDGLARIISQKGAVPSNSYREVYYRIIPQNATLEQIHKIKPLRYVGPFNLREGGTVVAATKIDKNGNLDGPVFVQHFDKIDNIPVTVTFASSVESGEGDAEHLVDGNPDTYWHTMWSVTMANFPHWIDFDCGTEKMLKGFA
ncbi:MAG: beta-galactosidase, partial [Prevotella sp.]|nr:beta-galactosidase [Prevotella sp.]